ncbi:MAG TPA: hypothetical protein VK791_10790 [bacterium]|jgi:hypothetical protein|nr:hypothetical protein [bacterium]
MSAQFYRILMVFILSIPSFASADLEWITGETPKATNEKPASTIIRDAPGEENHTVTTGNQDVIVSILTTCTKLVNNYPADSVNYFYLDKNNQISYYAYFLIKPTSRIHTATVEWYSPSNIRIAKFDQDFRVSFVDRLLTFQNETYQWFMLNMTLGMDHLVSQFGQTGLPRDVGLYTIRLTVDGQLVGISFFYVKPGENKKPAPISTAAPATTPSSNDASNMTGLLPMSTPISKDSMMKSAVGIGKLK